MKLFLIATRVLAWQRGGSAPVAGMLLGSLLPCTDCLDAQETPTGQVAAPVMMSQGEFGRIRAIAADDDGTVYAGDVHTGLVTALSAAGDLLWTAGGIGDGPAEVRRLRGLAVNQELVFVADETSRSRLLEDRWTVSGGVGMAVRQRRSSRAP